MGIRDFYVLGVVLADPMLARVFFNDLYASSFEVFFALLDRVVVFSFFAVEAPVD